jgi:hypothetical protein
MTTNEWFIRVSTSLNVHRIVHKHGSKQSITASKRARRNSNSTKRY